MRLSASCLCIAASLAATAASAACEIPSLVRAIPDGSTATEAELLQAQAVVQAYVRAMDDYIACENQELRAGSGQTTAEFPVLIASRIETARNEVDTVATRFNDQVRAFRAANRIPEPTRSVPLPGDSGLGNTEPGAAPSSPFDDSPPGNAPPAGAPRFND